MQTILYKKRKNIKKYKKGTLQNLKIKFYYRPDWWKYKYVRWISVGKRKNISRKKHYSIFWLYKKLNSNIKSLFVYKTLKQRKERNFISQTVKNRFFNEITVNKTASLEKFVSKFYCILNAVQAKYVIKKGWVLVNGKVSQNAKLVLKGADIVTLTPIVWNRLAVWFSKLHNRRKNSILKQNQKKYKLKKLKSRKKQRAKQYKNFKTFVLFRKINSIAVLHPN